MNSKPTINLPYSNTDNLILKYDNSFNAQFVKTGERPQNFIKNVDPAVRYVKYPRMSLLMQEKNSWTKKRNHPPVYIKADLEDYNLAELGKFDVIYCDPPWEEYEKKAKKLGLFQEKLKHYKSMPLEQLKKINVGQISDSPSFIFLWAGTEHLQDARQLLKEWGFKRCEDIVWVKTNENRKKIPQVSEDSIMIRVKEHCLMGYKGDSKKAFDNNFIHPNIDIDVVITEQPEIGSLSKPSEVYDIIQRFCLGRKRIELFGTNNNIRNGWLTIGNQIAETKFILNEYNKWFQPVSEIPSHFHGGRNTGTTPGIESVRPKEDSHQSQNQLQSQRSLNEDEGKRSMAKSENGK